MGMGQGNIAIKPQEWGQKFTTKSTVTHGDVVKEHGNTVGMGTFKQLVTTAHAACQSLMCD